ncbi:MAG TPA: hypothetical protein VFP37_13280 [Steroidobacteraceae bacterium]|nr:hypothetical protein [Steroidobacteraceae bacterium]
MNVRCWATALGCWLLPLTAGAQTTPGQQRDAAVGDSISYVFATDLGSGVYDLGGRTLQIYRLTWSKPLREATARQVGAAFDLPVTFGFFDFNPADVVSHGIPTRVDSFATVPGFHLDYLLRGDWHLMPYARAGFSVASSSVDGWLWGTGVQLERRAPFQGWDGLARSELAIAGVNYRHDLPNDRFVRLRQGFDFTRTLPWRIRDRSVELGLYGIFDVIVDSPAAPLAGDRNYPMQAEFGFTCSTRPRFRVWRFDAPRLGFGYRLAGELSAWRLVIGAPF